MICMFLLWSLVRYLTMESIVSNSIVMKHVYMPFPFNVRSYTLVLPHDEKSIVTASWWNMTFFVQREVTDTRTTPRWKVWCYCVIVKHDFFRSAWGHRRSYYLTMKSLLLLPRDETWLFSFSVRCQTLVLRHDEKSIVTILWWNMTPPPTPHFNVPDVGYCGRNIKDRAHRLSL